MEEAADKEIRKLAEVVAAYNSLRRVIEDEFSAFSELKLGCERMMGELENLIHGEPAAAEEKSALLKKDITSVKDELAKLARKNVDCQMKLSSLSKVIRQLPLRKNTQQSKRIGEDMEKFLELAENNIPFPVAKAVSAGVAALAVAALAVWYVKR